MLPRQPVCLHLKISTIYIHRIQLCPFAHQTVWLSSAVGCALKWAQSIIDKCGSSSCSIPAQLMFVYLYCFKNWSVSLPISSALLPWRLWNNDTHTMASEENRPVAYIFQRGCKIKTSLPAPPVYILKYWSDIYFFKPSQTKENFPPCKYLHLSHQTKSFQVIFFKVIRITWLYSVRENAVLSEWHLNAALNPKCNVKNEIWQVFRAWLSSTHLQLDVFFLSAAEEWLMTELYCTSLIRNSDTYTNPDPDHVQVEDYAQQSWGDFYMSVCH